MYLRLTWAALMLPKCSGCFLLVPEECMPPGAASREQQQQQRACASTARQQPTSQQDAWQRPLFASDYAVVDARRRGVAQPARVL